MNPSTALARVVVDELVRNGITEVVVSPGSRSAPLAMAVADADANGLLTLHVRVDERVAAFTALGLAKAAGAPTAVITTSGTAVANLHPAVAEAHHGGVPLLVLTADRPAELRGVGANQTLDQAGIFRASVRLLLELAADDRPGQVPYWRSSVSRAVIAAVGAISADPGPVHCNVGFRDPLVPDGDMTWVDSLDGRGDGGPWTSASNTIRSVGIDTGSTVHDGSSTLMVIGDAPRACVDAAWGVATEARWPVIAEPQSRSVGRGVACGSLVAGSNAWVSRHAPERVLVVGRPTLSRQIARLVSGAVAPVDVVTAGGRWPDAAHAARRVYTAFDLRPGTAPSAASPALLTAWAEAGRQAHLAVDRVLDESLADGRPPSGIAALREALRALPPDAILFLGSSSVIRDADLLAVPLPGRVLTNRGVGGIDGTVSSAVGAALASRWPGYAIMGDLTFLHDANGLLIGPDEPRPDLCVIVLNDDGGGIFGLLEPGAPEHAGVFERVFGTPHGVDIAALCAATRTPHEVVEVEKLAAALAPRPGLRVVEVVIDRHGHRDLFGRLRIAVAEALG